MQIPLVSPAFLDGGWIPSEFTCDGDDTSPPLAWGSIPSRTKSLAIVCDDLDCLLGKLTHWVVYNIRPEVTHIRARVPRYAQLPPGAVEGVNDFGEVGYEGPGPPVGTHRYGFTIYAFDTIPRLDGVATKARLLEAMHGHVLASGRLIGRYARLER